MQQTDLFLIFPRPLETAGVRYMVSGSVASMVYGEPRLTNGVDIVIALDYHQSVGLAALFPLDAFYCPPEEVIAMEARRPQRGHFNIIHHATGHKADMYTADTDPLQAWGLSHRQAIELEPGKSLWIAPREYVILKKLEYYREGHSEKHLLDIRGMLDVSREALDETFLQDHIRQMHLEAEWKLVLQRP